MARRFRVIQYDGPEEWIIGTISHSIQGEFRILDGRIQAWEVAEGEKVVGREPIKHADERFKDIDGIPLELCAHNHRLDNRPLDATCGACGGSLASVHRPEQCARRSKAKPPSGNKPR